MRFPSPVATRRDVIGALKDQTGHFSSGFYTITGASVVGLALTFWLEKMRSRPQGIPGH